MKQAKSKILFFFTVLVSSFLRSENAFDNLINFKQMKANHKQQWLDHRKKMHDKKIDMLKQKSKDWANYDTDNLKDMKSVDNTDEAKAKFAQDKLNKAIDLHKKHVEQYKKLHMTKNQETQDLQAKHDEEFNKFQTKLSSSAHKDKEKDSSFGFFK